MFNFAAIERSSDFLSTSESPLWKRNDAEKGRRETRRGGDAATVSVSPRLHVPASPSPRVSASPRPSGRPFYLGVLLKALIATSLILAISSLITAQANIPSRPISYSTSATTPSPIPPGMGFTVDISGSISGTVTITAPSGAVRTVSVSMSAPGSSTYGVTLNEIGTYSVSESYNIVLTGSTLGDPVTVTDAASSGWSFSNSIPGGEGTLKVSSDVSFSDVNHSNNISVSVSGMSVTIRTTKFIAAGTSVYAKLDGTWSVDSSMSIQSPPVVDTGNIEVRTNLEEAEFTLSGIYDGSGTFKRWADIPVGMYTIRYDRVPGYETPAPEAKTLTKDGTITFTGEYRKYGTIEVHTNLAAANFSISGPKDYSGSGESWTKTEVPAGEYTITYADVPGYETPPQEIKALDWGGMITFTGEYKGIGTIEAYTNLTAATFSVSGPENYTGSGTSWTETKVPVGEYTITYSDVPDHKTPPSEMKTLTPGGTVTFIGEYIPSTETIVVKTNLSNATFSLSGIANYTEADFIAHDFETYRTWTLAEAQVGEYTIAYGDVPGYETPSPETKVVTSGEAITFIGEYRGIGTIEVHTNREGAVFNLSGPENYGGSGILWIKTEASAGVYTITYSDLLHHTLPSSEIKTLAPGGTIIFTGEYIDTGTIEVHTNVAAATFGLSGPASYDGTGKFWTQEEAPVGVYTIVYDNTPGYETPPTETKTLAPSGMVSFTGTYTSISDAIYNVSVTVSPTVPAPTIAVTVNAEPKGSALFSIADVASGDLAEIPSGSGTYIASFAVPQGVDVTNQPIEIMFINAQGDVFTHSSRTLSIDTLARILSVRLSNSFPASNELVVITVRAEPGGSASFSINGVASGGMREERDLPGIYTANFTVMENIRVVNEPVEIVFTDTVGNVATNSDQMITIGYVPEIYSVEVTGSPVKAGDTIVVSMLGDVGGAATFSIIGIVDNVPMTESISTPGLYTGEYVTPEGTNATDAVVSVKLINAGGVVTTNEDETVTIQHVLEIYSVEVTGSPVKAGDTIVVSMLGDVGGAAIFSIIGIVDNVPMTESASAPGSYTGEYVAPEGANVTDAVVSVELMSPAGIVTTNADKTVTIQHILEIDSVKVSGSPAKAGDTIVVSMFGDGGGTATFSIIDVVDDVSMTESTSTPGSYTGEYVTPEGIDVKNAVVSVKLISAARIVTTNELRKVTIDSIPPAIESVDLSGSPAKAAGDVITVALLGEPGGVSTFSIANIAQDVPMQESTPGTYEGSYTAAEGLNVRDAKIVVHLADARGNVSADESKTVSISTAPWDVNGDGVVDFSDLEAVGSNLGDIATPELDLNSDGVIDALDLALIGMHFGEEYGQGGGILVNASPLSPEALAPFATSDYLFQNYPNPCNPGTWIPFMLARGGEAFVTIYSPAGRLIRRLDLGYRDPGIHVSKDRAAYWDGNNKFGEQVASGVYFYHIQSGAFSFVRKMLVCR